MAINLIADPDWDEARFATVRQWCMDVPEIVNISVNTPYPGTETWIPSNATSPRGTTACSIFNIACCRQNCRLKSFYRELIETQRVLYMKHLGWRTLWDTAGIVAGQLVRGQTNFLKSLFRFNSVYDHAKLLADHAMPVRYEVPLPSLVPNRSPKPSMCTRRAADATARSMAAQNNSWRKPARGAFEDKS